ncbi:unnamed protein product, partial [Meganyctiphanes norvegica]
MDWHWCLILLILCTMQTDYAEACDDDFKKALLQEFENLLDTKLNPMNTQMNQINGKLATFESKLELLGGTAGDIHTGTEGLDRRSSESQLTTHNVNTMQLNLVDKFDSYEESINEIKSLSNNSFEELNNLKSYLEEKVSRVENDVSMILSDVKQAILPIDDMAGSINKIKQNIEYFKIPITELNFLEHESNALLKSVRQGMDACKGPSNAIMTQSSNIIQKMEEINENVWLNSMFMLAGGIDSCPEGVMVSTKCFTVIRDRPSNWTEAEKQCQSQGLVLAEPSDTVVVSLRRFLFEIYGDGSFWVNAIGDLRNFQWQRTNKVMDADSPLWSPGQPGDRVTPIYCLSLLAWEEDWTSSPGQPYHSRECSYIYNYPLCERLLQESETRKSPIIGLKENISEKLGSMENKIIDSIIMYNKSIDRILQDTDTMKGPILAVEENLSIKINFMKQNISTSQDIIDTLAQNISTSKEIIDNMEKNISSSLEKIDKQR